jgi:hypothetical protein
MVHGISSKRQQNGEGKKKCHYNREGVCLWLHEDPAVEPFGWDEEEDFEDIF